MVMKLFTVASDTRLADLAVLLESTNRVTSSPIQVIPFDDNISLTRELCNIYGANLCKPDPFWDRLGQHIFGIEAHRERGDDVQAWRYFRKFNAISTGEGSPFLFIDANSVLLRNPSGLLNQKQNNTIIFGHFSKGGRNFSGLGKYIIDKLAPGRMRNHGYGAGFWIAHENTLKLSMFQPLVDLQLLRSLIGPAPEQAILNLVIVLENISAGLLRERTSNLEYLMIGSDSDRNEQLVQSHQSWSVQRPNKARNPSNLAAAKWTGNYHQGAFNFPQRSFHNTFAQEVMKRVANHSDLYQTLSNMYSTIYGHQNV